MNMITLLPLSVVVYGMNNRNDDAAKLLKKTCRKVPCICITGGIVVEGDVESGEA